MAEVNDVCRHRPIAGLPNRCGGRYRRLPDPERDNAVVCDTCGHESTTGPNTVAAFNQAFTEVMGGMREDIQRQEARPPILGGYTALGPEHQEPPANPFGAQDVYVGGRHHAEARYDMVNAQGEHVGTLTDEQIAAVRVANPQFIGQEHVVPVQAEQGYQAWIVHDEPPPNEMRGLANVVATLDNDPDNIWGDTAEHARAHQYWTTTYTTDAPQEAADDLPGGED